MNPTAPRSPTPSHPAAQPGAAPGRLPPGLRPADDSDWDLAPTIPISCAPFEWPGPAGDTAAAHPTLTPPPASAARRDIPWADRRLADRLPVRPGARAEIHRWGGGRGPDVAEELLNVSECGLGVRLSAPVRRGERFDVTLWGARGEWCGRGMAVVRWVVIGEAGAVFAGLRLNRPLTLQALIDLT